MPKKVTEFSIGVVWDQQMYNRFWLTDFEKAELAEEMLEAYPREDQEQKRGAKLEEEVTRRIVREVERTIEATVAASNLIYRKYARLQFRVDEVVDGRGLLPGNCGGNVNVALSGLKGLNKARGPASMAHRHLFSGCWFDDNIVGGAFQNTMCGTLFGENVGVTSLATFGSAFVTFAHEMGHALNARHPVTGEPFKGIMDPSGWVDPVDEAGADVPFAPARVTEMCKTVRGLLADGECAHMRQAVPDEAVCGDGVLGGAEECECPDGREKCGSAANRCVDCRKVTQPAAECSAVYLSVVPYGDAAGTVAAEECCSSEGVLAPVSVSCGGGRGNCAHGLCVNRCARYFNKRPLCGTPIYNGCRQRCVRESDDYCSGSLRFDHYGASFYLGDHELGAKCMLSDGNPGICKDSRCAEDPNDSFLPVDTAGAPSPVPSPTPEPVPSPTPKPTKKPTKEPTPKPAGVKKCTDVKDRGSCCSYVVDGEPCHPSVKDSVWTNGSVCRPASWIEKEGSRKSKAAWCSKRPRECNEINRSNCCKYKLRGQQCHPSKSKKQWGVLGDAVCAPEKWIKDDNDSRASKANWCKTN